MNSSFVRLPTGRDNGAMPDKRMTGILIHGCARPSCSELHGSRTSYQFPAVTDVLWFGARGAHDVNGSGRHFDGQALLICRDTGRGFSGVCCDQERSRGKRNGNAMGVSRCGPCRDSTISTAGEDEDVILVAAGGEALLESVAAEKVRERFGGKVSGFWLIDLGVVRQIAVVDQTEGRFGVFRVCSIFAPVVPDRHSDVVGDVREEFAGE